MALLEEVDSESVSQDGEEEFPGEETEELEETDEEEKDDDDDDELEGTGFDLELENE